MSPLEKLSYLLKDHTQAELAEKIGMSQGYLSQLANGKRTRIEYEWGRKIDELFELIDQEGGAA